MEYVIKIIIPTEPYWLPLKPPCVCAYVMFLEKKATVCRDKEKVLFNEYIITK